MYKALRSYRVVDTVDGTCECVFKNKLTNQTVVRFLNVTPEQIYNWQNGEAIQDAMPQLSASERELFLNGGIK